MNMQMACRLHIKASRNRALLDGVNNASDETRCNAFGDYVKCLLMSFFGALAAPPTIGVHRDRAGAQIRDRPDTLSVHLNPLFQF